MMEITQIFTRTFRVVTTWLCRHKVGSVVLCLIISVLLVACGGTASPEQSADTAAAGSEQAATSQGDEEAEDAEASAAEEEAEEEGTPGAEEFGLAEAELIARVETVESQIADCMNDAGFEYVAVDYNTVRAAMDADKTVAGLGDEEFAAQFGYGISTRLIEAELPPQQSANTPAAIGLGEQNIQIFNTLSEADQEAYNRSLFGENTDETFAVALEAEDFSQTGGCTRTAVEQAFSPEEVTAAYYNPKDALVEQDPRVIAAIASWADCMRAVGFDYNNPEEVEPDLEEQLDAILDGAESDELSSEAQAQLAELQGEEKVIAVADLGCDTQFIVPAVQQVETEVYGAPQN
jgi:hypothetical protein